MFVSAPFVYVCLDGCVCQCVSVCVCVWLCLVVPDLIPSNPVNSRGPLYGGHVDSESTRGSGRDGHTLESQGCCFELLAFLLVTSLPRRQRRHRYIHPHADRYAPALLPINPVTRSYLRRDNKRVLSWPSSGVLPHSPPRRSSPHSPPSSPSSISTISFSLVHLLLLLPPAPSVSWRRCRGARRSWGGSGSEPTSFGRGRQPARASSTACPSSRRSTWPSAT